jgi:hypothetical protein
MDVYNVRKSGGRVAFRMDGRLDGSLRSGALAMRRLGSTLTDDYRAVHPLQPVLKAPA